MLNMVIVDFDMMMNMLKSLIFVFGIDVLIYVLEVYVFMFVIDYINGLVL